MSRPVRAVMAILVAGAVLWLAGWLDGHVLHDMQRQIGVTFDVPGLALALSLGTLAAAGSVLLLAIIAWHTRFVVVGATYAVVGAFCAFLPWIEWQFVPALPRPVADAVNQVFIWSDGPLGAVHTIGAGMLVVGLAVVGRSFRGRSTRPMPVVIGDATV